MPDIPYEKLGGLERPKDERDFPLGATYVPVKRPSTLGADMSWFKRNWQAQIPTCGPHALSHDKAVQDHASVPSLSPRYTPRFTGIRMKDPRSPVYDGYAPDAGTDMRHLFQAAVAGQNTFAPLENDTLLPLAQYLDPSVLTPAMLAESKNNLIKSYAFDETPGGPTYDSIADAVNQWKAVILLIKCDEGFWGTSTPTFTTPKYGHFILAYDWDDNTGELLIVDSAEPDEQFALKRIAKQYIQPQFFLEAGTTVDIPPSIKQVLSHPQLTPQQKISITQQILTDIAEILQDMKKEI
ncbi:MAG TPA: hypothetical protein VNJ52_04935 [Patescibacteria group bacterium]|nr:hypothetical protein [Patescibacteria group bacterium]